MKTYKYTGSITFQGKRYYVRADTKAELEVKKAMKRRDLAEGKIVVTGNTSVENWTAQCIATYKVGLRESTLSRFNYLVKGTILREIGTLQMDQVRPVHCQQVLNKQAGKSATQINEVYNALRFIFKYAKKNGIIATDPTEDLIKPKAKAKQRRRALTPEERFHIIKVGKTKRKYYFFLLMLFCGCRPSEAGNAKGEDIIQIDGYNALHIRGTKTNTGYEDRYVPIPDELYELIKGTPNYQYIAQYDSKLIKTGQNYQYGKITEQNRHRLWQKFCNQVNLSMGAKTYRNKLIPPLPLADDLVPYCLRHEYCTELARQGIDLRTAQRLMGHSSIKMTANIYTNLEKSDTIKVADLLGATQGATHK